MKINWAHLFSDRVLERGWAYYCDDKILDVSRNGDTYDAYVIGSDFYPVEITVKGSKISRMKCGCPYAEEGHRCKHMAAVLYELEERGALDTEEDEDSTRDDGGKNKKASGRTRKQVFPFAGNTDENSGSGGASGDRYRYYDMGQMTSELVIYDDVYREAQQLVADGRVKLVDVTEGYIRRGPGIYARVTERIIAADGVCAESSGKEAPMMVRASREQIISTSCNVMGCYNSTDAALYYGYGEGRREICAHTTAMLILLDRYIAKNNPGDATDMNAQILLQRYRKRRSTGRRAIAAGIEDNGKKADINIEPRFEFGEYGETGVSFKIGRNKLFVVKNICEMQETVEAEGVMKLGKSDEIDFAQETFTEDSEKFYEFISEEIKSEELREFNLNVYGRNGTSSGSENIKNVIPLYGRRLDTFFEIMKDSTADFVYKSRSGRKRNGTVMMRDKLPEVELEIAPIAGNAGFDGISVTGTIPNLTAGVDYKYYFDGHALNRAGNDELEMLDMLRSDPISSDVDLVIGRKNLAEFFYRVLPALQDFAKVSVKDRELIDKYLYPEATFEFFLDADSDDVTCDVRVMYGDRECVLYDPEDDDTPAEDFRDLQRENEIREVIEELFPYREPSSGAYACGCDEDLIYDVLEDGIDTLMQFGEVQATDRFRGLTVKRKPQITVGVRLESDLLNLSISSEGLTEDELLDLLSSYRLKRKFHRLKNGSFISTDDGTLEELSEMLEMMQVSPSDFVKGRMQLPAYRALYLDKMLEKNTALYTRRDKHFKSLVRDFKTVGDSDYEVPESLQDIMRNYQKFGYRWLRTVEACGFGGILADDMGLGKTLQVIAVILASKLESPDDQGTALIVTPASLVYNWQEEFAKFAPQLDVCVITGTKTERKSKLRNYHQHDVLITSYDLLKRDILEYEDLGFTYQVIDEAQSIKNHTTAAAKAVKVINSRVRFALTGTPIENRLSELWSIFDYLMPGFLYSYDRFRRELEHPITKNEDETAMEQLKRMVEPFILRRLKSEVLQDLPDKIEEVQYVGFEKAQQQLYDGQAIRMKQMLGEQSEENYMKSKIRILAELTRIRQICCDPSLCFEDYSGGSAKREACMELIRSAIDGEHKMLVFSQFTSMLELLEADLAKENIQYYKITGSTKKEDRTDLVRRFNEDSTPVFLISLKAGGTGLNLTGADIVIHYDPWWNLAAQNQATDRAHRIGQEKTVSVYKLIAKGSIEEKILRMQEDKKALADEILSGETGGLMNMSREDLMELL